MFPKNKATAHAYWSRVSASSTFFDTLSSTKISCVNWSFCGAPDARVGRNARLDRRAGAGARGVPTIVTRKSRRSPMRRSGLTKPPQGLPRKSSTATPPPDTAASTSMTVVSGPATTPLMPRRTATRLRQSKRTAARRRRLSGSVSATRSPRMTSSGVPP
jgi:hypothetical protein